MTDRERHKRQRTEPDTSFMQAGLDRGGHKWSTDIAVSPWSMFFSEDAGKPLPARERQVRAGRFDRSLMEGCLWLERLSMITTSPGLRRKMRICVIQALNPSPSMGPVRTMAATRLDETPEMWR